MANAIEARGLRKRFGKATALDGLDLTVRTGEVHAFLGPNGAGKTTTIRILLGLLHKDGGDVSLLGGDPWRDATTLHGRLAYVPGDVTLWPSLTGGEIIDLLARLRGDSNHGDSNHGDSNHGDLKRRQELIERFDLDPSKKARAYSKGNRQKVALIAALASDAELLVLDEPTSGLDPLMEAAFRDCVAAERRGGRTVLLSSHILDEAEALADRVTIIRAGRTVETGTLAELRHLTRTTVDAELDGPLAPDSLPGAHDVTLEGTRLRCEVDNPALNEVLRRLTAVGVRTLTCRLELIGSARVGRQAPLASAIVVATEANVILTAALCVVLPVLGLPAAGSVALALAIGTCGLAFTGVSAVAAQLTAGARAARGLAIAALGVAFLSRAVGDSAGASGPGWLTWVLPLGWTETLAPFAGERWWVLALPLALFAGGVWLSFALAARRDHGAGLFPERPGRPAASAALRDPFALAWRLQWPALAGWVAGYAVMFAVCGAAAKGIGQQAATSGALTKEFTRIGGQSAIVNAYLAALMLLGGLVAAAYGVSTLLRLHAEETRGTADPILAGPVGRARWGLSHLVVAFVGTTLLLAVAGLATGLGYGLAVGGAGAETARMLGAGLAQLPAAAVIIGVAVLAFGALPDGCVAVGWTAVGVAVALNIFGQALQLSHWALDVSPFTHVPKLPGGSISATPLVALSVIALALCALGLSALRRRDIG